MGWLSSVYPLSRFLVGVVRGVFLRMEINKKERKERNEICVTYGLTFDTSPLFSSLSFLSFLSPFLVLVDVIGVVFLRNESCGGKKNRCYIWVDFLTFLPFLPFRSFLPFPFFPFFKERK